MSFSLAGDSNPLKHIQTPAKSFTHCQTTSGISTMALVEKIKDSILSRFECMTRLGIVEFCLITNYLNVRIDPWVSLSSEVILTVQTVQCFDMLCAQCRGQGKSCLHGLVIGKSWVQCMGDFLHHG